MKLRCFAAKAAAQAESAMRERMCRILEEYAAPHRSLKTHGLGGENLRCCFRRRSRPQTHASIGDERGEQYGRTWHRASPRWWSAA